jgi:NADH-quinone oxidoreductase subunit G
LLSPCATTEDLLASCLFAKEALGLKQVYAGGRQAGAGDDFLIRENKNPNWNGLKIAAAAFGLEVRPFDRLLEDADAGALKALWAAGTEMPADATLVSAVLAGLEVFVAQAQNASAALDAADVVLPASSYVESEGTFVNWYGRLQKLGRAFAPRGASRPHWAWVGAMLGSLGFTWKFRGGADVFDQLRERAEALRGFSFAEIPATGRVLPGFAPREWPRRAPRPASAPSTPAAGANP